MREIFYTYLHRRSDTGTVFYVGKGRDRRAWSLKNRNAWWKNIVAKAGGRTVEVLAKWPTEVEAFEHEKFLIACFRDLDAPLCNLIAGGAGTSGWRHSDEARAKIAGALVGRPCSPETRERIRVAQAGISRGPLSVETRAKLSAVIRGRRLPPRSAEHCAAISAAKRGISHGPYAEAHCTAISAGKRAANAARRASQ